MPEVVRVDAALMEGWLEKRSKHLKVWRRRWVVLTRDGVLTFKEAPRAIRTTAMEPTNALLFAKGLEAKAVGALQYDRVNMFELFCDGAVFPFSADSLGDRDKWVRAIIGDRSESGPTHMADSDNDINEPVKSNSKISSLSATTASDSGEDCQDNSVESAKVDSADVDSDDVNSDDAISDVKKMIRYLPFFSQEGRPYLERQGDCAFTVIHESEVAYRKSPNFNDCDTSRAGVSCGAIVVGESSNGWLKLSTVPHKVRPKTWVQRIPGSHLALIKSASPHRNGACKHRG